MEARKLAATKRTESGKGPARRLRSEGRIPAVAYGKEIDSIALSVAPDDVHAVLESPHGRNSVIDLEIEGDKTVKALLMDFQYHPVSRELLHADFVQIHEGKPIDVNVPLVLEGKPKGVVLGGILRQVFRTLPVRCVPEKIPAQLKHDVSEVELEQAVAAKELVVPEGVTVRLRDEQTIAAVVGEKRRPDEEEEAAAAAKEGEEGKPAEGEDAKAEDKPDDSSSSS